MSSSDSTRKTPRWPPESAGFEHRREADLVGGAPALGERRAPRRSAAAARPRRRAGARIATLCVIRCAVSTPIPGRPRASATAATTGTARSALTVSTPSSLMRAVALSTAAASAKSTTFAMSASCEAGRVRVAVDGRDAQPELLRPQDRAALVPAGADEEDGLRHGAMMLLACDQRVVERREQLLGDPRVGMGLAARSGTRSSTLEKPARRASSSSVSGTSGCACVRSAK